MPAPSVPTRRASLGGDDPGRIGILGLLAPAQNIIGRDRPMETLQIQVTDVRDLYRSLDGAERPLGNQDLPRPCFITQAGCEICHAADRRVLAAMFKSDLTQCGIASRYADSESESVALSAPVLGQLLDLVAHLECHPHGTLRMIGTFNRVVEDDHDAVPEKPFQRTFVLEYELSHVLVVLAENGRDLFGFRLPVKAVKLQCENKM